MKYQLFSTLTCPNCPAVKKYVEENISIPGEFIDESNEKFYELAKELKVMNVPTMIIFNEENKEIFRGHEESQIADFINSKK